MGVERAVTRWYVLRQTIQWEIEALQAQLAAMQTEGRPVQERSQTEERLARARARLLTLGPCPRSMMG
ncbi:MAG TPA: hypothetical protein VGD98_22825 [Ktedonobacteraceae bacterium]